MKMLKLYDKEFNVTNGFFFGRFFVMPKKQP